MGKLDSNQKKKKDYKLSLNENNFLKIINQLMSEFFSQALENTNIQLQWGNKGTVLSGTRGYINQFYQELILGN